MHFTFQLLDLYRYLNNKIFKIENDKDLKKQRN